MEWDENCLENLTVKIGSGATPHGGETNYKTSGISLIRSQNVYDFEFRFEGLAFIDEEQASALANVEVHPKDILLNITGDSVGRCCMVPDSILPARVNQHVSIIRTRTERLDPKFLLYYINEPRNKAVLLQVVHGATRRALTKGIIQSYKVRFPSLPIQCRIAEILGALDNKIECNRRINQTLEQMAMALYKHWFVDFGPFRDGEFVDSEFGRIPKGWEVKGIGEICTTQYGYTASAVSEPIGPRFLRITDMNKHLLVDWESVPFCKADTDALEKYRLSEGDILVSRMADPGKVIRADGIRENAVFASYLIRVKPRSSSLSLWLYYFLRSNVYQTFISNAESGTVQKNLNAKELTSPKVAVSPQDLLDKFNQKVLPIRCQQIANQKEINLLAHMRDYLLPKLLSGEVEISMI